MKGASEHGQAEEGENSANCDSQTVTGGLGGTEGEGDRARFWRPGGTAESDRKGDGDHKELAARIVGGIGSRLIQNLEVQKAQAMLRLAISLKEVAVNEDDLERINRELEQARQMISEGLEEIRADQE